MLENKLANYDFIEQVSDWTPEMAGRYRDMAGIGYISKDLLLSQLKLINSGQNNAQTKKGISFIVNYIFKVLKWEHIYTYNGDPSTHNYSFTILRNLNSQKLVCTFSGTKDLNQLKSEIIQTSGQPYFREGKTSKIKLMKYFHELYQKFQAGFLTIFTKAKDPKIRQYIFTGHSLGGAMASIALFDLVRQGVIQTDLLNKSPVLITYGQPRTGNYMFVNEVSKMAPIIYRHVNDLDLIPGTPECVRQNEVCVNEFGKASIDLNEIRYNIKYFK
jgi:hypothetical protein